MEILTRAIANEYRDRALLLPSNGLQDIEERRKLREELQARCNLTDYRDQLPDCYSRQIRREVGDMVIVGYYAHGNKHYVAFKDETDAKDRFMITDGFHDRPVTERNQGKYEGYVKIDKTECNIKKIIGRIRGTRPWHPLLRLLQKEVG